MSKLIVSPNDSIYAEMIVDTKDKLIGKEKVTATIKTNGERTYYYLSVNFDVLK